MTTIPRSLTYYWRTNIAVVLGVATAASVLAGALIVGDSVRGSLRDLVLLRLGRADQIVVSTQFFREGLAGDLSNDQVSASSFSSIVPIIAVQGVVSDQASGRRVSRVMVYGVDERFWRFHGVPLPAAFTDNATADDGRVSPALASDLGVAAGATVLVRVERPSAIPIESLHGRKDDRGRTMRLTVGSIVQPPDAGEFSVRPQQGPVRAVFVSLKRLQKELDLAGRVNTLLVSDRPGVSSAAAATALRVVVRRWAMPEDVGLTVRDIPAQRELSVQSPGGLIDTLQMRAVDEASRKTSMRTRPVFTYLANGIRSGSRQVPYSLVTAMDLASLGCSACSGESPIVVNDWTARELGVKVGDPLALDFFVWEEPGQLANRTADFRVAAVVPIEGAAADRELAPVYPGLSDADTLSDWDPPFPIDLKRVRPVDEAYWKAYRTTPKAFIPYEVGAKLWSSRYGDRTSVRILPAEGELLASARDQYVTALRRDADPLALGLSVQEVRSDALGASRGATDFAEYFTYFSFFLVISALLLAGLFFRLGLEQRAREVGLLRAVGFSPAHVRRLFLTEGLVLAGIGGLLGAMGGVGYAALMIAGLRTWWAGAVRTTAIALHVSVDSLAAGAIGGIVAALLWIWWTLRGFGQLSERTLLTGVISRQSSVDSRRSSVDSRQSTVVSRQSSVPSPQPPVTSHQSPALLIAFGFSALGGILVVLAVMGRIDRAAAFFGAGASFLVSCLGLLSFALTRPRASTLGGSGSTHVWKIGLRNATARPGRSVLSVAVIAAATFILVSVEAFRLETPSATDRRSGTGGYPLLVDLLVPMGRDPNTREGREALGLTSSSDLTVQPFRVLPGDDASCLNLYEPKRPRMLGVNRTFIESNRFAFSSSQASTREESANPWLLLGRMLGDQTVPVIADANSMTYVLHKTLGDEVTIDIGGRQVRLRLVAALDDSIFQSELLMSEANFTRLFPDQQGYQFLLVDLPPARTAEIEATIESAGADLGADAMRTGDRLAEFHTVENTYLSTFQALGGLGLLLGTIGLGAVLMRNVLERRREIALLGAVGYRRPHVLTIVLAENLLLLALGLAVGTVCALVAITPAVMERGGGLPAGAETIGLLVAVLSSGLLSSLLATRVALAEPVVRGLHAE